jgi:hypothetical protein
LFFIYRVSHKKIKIITSTPSLGYLLHNFGRDVTASLKKIF